MEKLLVVKARKLFVVLLVFFTQQFYAQISPCFHRIPDLNGHLRAPMIDSRGLFWAYANGELVSFDGFELKYYNLEIRTKSSQPIDITYDLIYEDKSGDLWICTSFSVSRYIRSQDQIESYPLPDDFKMNDKMLEIQFFSDSLIRLKCDTETIHFNLYDRKFSAIQNEKRKENLIQPKVEFRALNPNAGFQITQYQDGVVENKTYLNSEENALYADVIVESFITIGDSVCYFTGNGELFKIDLRTSQYSKLLEKGLDQIHNATGLSHFGTSLFIGSSGNGIALMEISNDSLLGHFTHDPEDIYSLPSNDAGVIYFDNNGNLFVEAMGKGYAFTNLNKIKFDILKPEPIATNESKDIFVRALAEDKQQRIWCGTHRNGIYLYDQQGNLLEHFKPFYDNGNVLAIEHLLCDTRGRIWISTWGGLMMWSEESNSFTKIEVADESEANPRQFNFVAQLKNGSLLVASEMDGCYVMSDELKPVLRPLRISGSEIKEVHRIFETDNGNIWLSGEDILEIIEMQNEGIYKVARSIPVGTEIKHFSEDRENDCMWMASFRGIIKMSTENYNYEVIEQDLPSKYCYSVLKDDSMNYWISTNRGISKYNPRSGSFRNFGIADGLQSGEFNSNSFLITSSGEMWYGGMRGINLFSPKEVRDFKTLPSIHLTSLKINDENVPISMSIGELEVLSLNYDQNTVSLNFKAIEFADAGSCKLQYLLEGFDDHWVISGNPGFLRYSNLPPGKYNLRIRTTNSDGIWSPFEKQIEIFIATPWYMSWWFIVLTVFGVISLVYSVYRYRIAQILKLQSVRNRISRDLHDDIGSTLGSISLYSSVAIKRNARSENIDDLLTRIGETSRDTIGKMSDIVWSVKADNDNMDQLVHRMKSFAAMLLGPANIVYQFEISTDLRRIKVGMEQRKTFFLVFKECVYNAQKYSACKNILICLKLERDKLVMKIKDDGVGFEDFVSGLNGNGINNMEVRARAAGCKLDIRSEGGVLVILSMNV